MTGKRPTGLFITGTSTGVGKTFVTAALARTLIARGSRVGVYKPVLSGNREPGPGPEAAEEDDAVSLWKAAGCPGELAQVCPQRFHAPLAPHLAAAVEGRTVDARLLRTGILPWQTSSDLVLVEGAGGLFSPLSENELNADLAADLEYPIAVVAANTLGVIHATLATLFAALAYHRPLRIAAVILNDVPESVSDPSRESNFDELKRRCGPVPVIQHGWHQTRVTDLDWFDGSRERRYENSTAKPENW